MNVSDINIQFSALQPLRKRLGAPDQRVLIILEHRYIACHLLLSRRLIDDNVLLLLDLLALAQFHWRLLMLLQHDTRFILHEVFIS